MFIASVVIFQVMVFIVLIFVLKRMMNKSFISATKHLEDMNQDFTKKEMEINKKLQGIKEKSDQTLSKAHSEAERNSLQIIKEAEQAREELLKQARSQSEEIIKQADISREQLISEIEDRIEKRAIDKACMLLEKSLPEDFRKSIHLRWLDDLVENGFSQMSEMSVQENINKIDIMSAFSLDETQKKNILKKMSSFLKKEVSLEETVDSSLIAGIIVTAGSLVLDGSLKNKIEENRRKIKGK
ncbi:MAG: F0F1 ATP synthase subunit delta [Candidatus Omnitrophota bacterium]